MKPRYPLLLSVLALILNIAHAQAMPLERSLFKWSESELQNEPGSCVSNPVAQSVSFISLRCDDPMAVWRQYAEQLLLSSHSNLEFDDSVTTALLRAVERNALITSAYARLYLFSRDRFPSCGRSLLPWVGGASLGSLRSGQVMRSALAHRLGGWPAHERLRDADFQAKFNRELGPLFGPMALREAALVLGEGNRAIFLDLFWQLHLGAHCGPQQVINTIEAEPHAKSDARLQRALKAWRALVQAQVTCDPDQIIKANHFFVEVEQYLVAQPLMYNGLFERLGGKALAPLVESAVPEVIEGYPDFLTFMREQGTPSLFANFANAHQRVAWMKDQLTHMENQFRARPEVLGPMFCHDPGLDGLAR